jgi:hypothetical protein
MGRWSHLIATVLVTGLYCVAAFSQNQDSSQSSNRPHIILFHPDPQHISNRLYRQVHVRSTADGKEYGFEDLDPLLWRETKYLLSDSESNKTTLDLLDEFSRSGAEMQIRDPVKRAILQRDLWAVFDWAGSSDLAEKLGNVIWRLALAPAEINSLPDTYALAIRGKEFPAEYDAAQPNRAFLPPDLFDANGPWVCVGASHGEFAAPGHEYAFSGRSVFLVFMRLPGGRQVTLLYLKQLAEMLTPLYVKEDFQGQAFPVWNPDVPQFPAGTEFALVRKMILPDQHHNLVLTPVTESVQIRHYRDIPPGTMRYESESRRSQSASEVKLDRARLFKGGHSGLLGVTPEDREFPVFMTHDNDPFEDDRLAAGLPVASLTTCTGCHLGPGIQSMMSFSFRGEHNPRLAETTPVNEVEKVVTWKQTQRNWKQLLQVKSPRAPSDIACKVTIPNGTAPPGQRPNASSYGNGALFTGLWPDGTVVFRRGGPGSVLPDGSLSMKFGWWRVVRGKLTIQGRRLDAPAPALRARIPEAYGDTGFQATEIIFPTEGCWEVTGKAGERSLRFVTRVVKIEKPR